MPHGNAVFTRDSGRVSPIHALGTLIALFALFGGGAMAQSVPLPRERPVVVPLEAAGPTPCQMRLLAIAVAETAPPHYGPGACGGTDLVRLKAVRMPDASMIAIAPAAELRCEMAEQVANWVRDDASPQFAPAQLASIENYDSYECRGRNRIVDAKVSEHGKGNALDVRSFRLTDGTVIYPTDVKVSHQLRANLRQAACARFSTVLGPGSDGYHEAHIHLDIAERHSHYSFCQWAVRDAPAVLVAHADVPLPPTRPFGLTAGNDK